MSINAAIGSSRVTVRTSGDPLWREKIDIIRQRYSPIHMSLYRLDFVHLKSLIMIDPVY